MEWILYSLGYIVIGMLFGVCLLKIDYSFFGGDGSIGMFVLFWPILLPFALFAGLIGIISAITEVIADKL